MTTPKCINPKGAKYCIDENCPARGPDGRHIVVVKENDDLKSDYLKKFSSKGGVTGQYNNKKPLPKPTGVQTFTPVPSHETDSTLFDINDEWFSGNVSFYIKAVGAEAVFYADPEEESTIVCKIDGGRKRDIHIVAKGNMRVKYGTHTIRSSKQLQSIGVNSDTKLQRAVAKGLIEVLSQPKFEAVEIRYMGRKDESRKAIMPSSNNLAELIFKTIKYLNEN